MIDRLFTAATIGTIPATGPVAGDTEGRPVECVRSVYRGDRYRIVSRLALGPGAPRGGGAERAQEGHHPGFPPGDLASRGPVSFSAHGVVQHD